MIDSWASKIAPKDNTGLSETLVSDTDRRGHSQSKPLRQRRTDNSFDTAFLPLLICKGRNAHK